MIDPTPMHFLRYDKQDWDQFVRQAANRAKFPVALSSIYASNKTDLFGMWLDSGKSWTQTVMAVERANELKNQSIQGWHAVQGKTPKGQFSDEKFKRLVGTRKSQGLYYEDADFPDDIDEAQFLYFKINFCCGNCS